MRSIGSSLFKPQTVLFAPEPRRGTRRNPAAGGLEHASCASIKKGIKRGQVRGVSRFFGLWPLLGGDNESKASCGVIRSGSGEPWFDRKERDL